jgi:hypothetical protein
MQAKSTASDRLQSVGFQMILAKMRGLGGLTETEQTEVCATRANMSLCGRPHWNSYSNCLPWEKSFLKTN